MAQPVTKHLLTAKAIVRWCSTQVQYHFALGWHYFIHLPCIPLHDFSHWCVTARAISQHNLQDQNLEHHQTLKLHIWQTFQQLKKTRECLPSYFTSPFVFSTTQQYSRVNFHCEKKITILNSKLALLTCLESLRSAILIDSFSVWCSRWIDEWPTLPHSTLKYS